MTGSPEGTPLKLDSPLLVNWEYASEERLAVRNKTSRSARAPASCPRACRASSAPKWSRSTSRRAWSRSRPSKESRPSSATCRSSPFGDAEFDCAVAAWVLYHLADVDRGIAELARVLKPGGTLVTATLGEGNMAELWEAVGDHATRVPSFGWDNGEQAPRRFVAATITRAHLSDRVPQVTGRFRARASHVVFVARQAK